MRILSNSSVALGGVLALAPCIPAANGQTFPAGVTPVRGAVTAVTANSVTVQTPQGPVFVQLVQPVKVFTRMPSDLGHITNQTFVGVTSSKGADGKEHATEVHIFPEELRGFSEGSYMMGGAQPGAASSSRMTNGAVSGSRMTNGAASGSRMTNGAVEATGNGSWLTVGSQQIQVPAGTPVTILAETKRPVVKSLFAMKFEGGKSPTVRARSIPSLTKSPSFLQPLDHKIPMIATKDIAQIAVELLGETWQGVRVVELEAHERYSTADVAAAFERALGTSVRTEIVPRARWEELFRAQGMTYPLPRIRMIDGFNEGTLAQNLATRPPAQAQSDTPDHRP